MTTNELQELISRRLERSMLGKNTVARYKGAASHVLRRIPIEAFGDESVVRAYRQTLSAQGRAGLGVVWPKIYEELCLAGLPCVPPSALTYRIQLPIIATDCIEILAIGLSFVNVADASWKDVQEIDGNVHLLRVPLSKKEKSALARLADYYWPNQDPPPTAPIIAISPRHPMIPMPVEMVSDAVTVLEEGGRAYREEDQLACRVYRAMCAQEMPLAEIEQRLMEVEKFTELPRGKRQRANQTAKDSLIALRLRNFDTFNKMWEAATRGEAQRVSLSNPTQPITTWAQERKATIKTVNARLMTSVQEGPRATPQSTPAWKKVINLAKDTKTG